MKALIEHLRPFPSQNRVTRVVPGGLRLGLSAVLCLLLLATDAPALAQDAGHTTVATNVRQGPGFDHRVLRILPAGTAVTLIGRNEDGTWLQLADGTWLYAELVALATAQADAPVTTVGSNVRSGPGLEYPVQTVLPTGTLLAVSGRNADGSWLQLADNLWIHATLVANAPLGLPVATSVSRPPPAPSPAIPTAPVPAVPSGRAWTDLDILRNHHLQEINALRAAHGRSALILAAPGPAQAHADEMATGGYASHWDRAGLSPYMRHARDAADGAGSENLHFTQYSAPSGICLAEQGDAGAWLTQALGQLADSPGHLDTLLIPEATTVRIGLARTCNRLVLVQVVGHDLIRWSQRPHLDADRILHLAGDIDPSTRLGSAAHVTVAWEPLPRPVPVHLLEQTRCYSLPRRVAIFARRTHRGQSARLTALRCPNPWRVQTQGSDGHRETYTLPVSQARTWETRVTAFTIALDLRDTISAYGDGIYTIGVWGTVDAQATLLGLYSVVGGDRSDLRW